MSVGLYMDVHAPLAVTRGLRARGVDVLTAQEDGRAELADPALLDRASSLGRALFTQDSDLLVEAERRLREGGAFLSVIYGHQLRVTVGQAVDDLELLSTATSPEEYLFRVWFLPLR